MQPGRACSNRTLTPRPTPSQHHHHCATLPLSTSCRLLSGGHLHHTRSHHMRVRKWLRGDLGRSIVDECPLSCFYPLCLPSCQFPSVFNRPSPSTHQMSSKSKQRRPSPGMNTLAAKRDWSARLGTSWCRGWPTMISRDNPVWLARRRLSTELVRVIPPSPRAACVVPQTKPASRKSHSFSHNNRT